MLNLTDDRPLPTKEIDTWVSNPVICILGVSEAPLERWKDQSNARSSGMRNPNEHQQWKSASSPADWDVFHTPQIWTRRRVRAPPPLGLVGWYLRHAGHTVCKHYIWHGLGTGAWIQAIICQGYPVTSWKGTCCRYWIFQRASSSGSCTGPSAASELTSLARIHHKKWCLSSTIFKYNKYNMTQIQSTEDDHDYYWNMLAFIVWFLTSTFNQYYFSSIFLP